MMSPSLFWFAFAWVGYSYIGYPMLIALMARVRPKQVRRIVGYSPTVSIIVPAHNEEEQVGRRVAELCQILARYPASSELIVVSDGSTDGTAEVARLAGRAQVIELNTRIGKSAAISRGAAAAQHDVIVFADVRQKWSERTLPYLVENFGDLEVGGASGDLVIDRASGAAGGVGAYWRYEKWLRLNETRVGSITGVTGAISAVRRELFQPVPAGVVLDDIYWALQIAMRGYRVVHDERAKAFDRLPEKTGDEFRRKVRTLSGNYQLVAALPGALLPWKNRVWFQFVSHKIARLAVPWALLLMLATNSMLLDREFYRVLFAAQISFYLLALCGLRWGNCGRVASLAASFVLLNAAAWMAFWFWISGRATGSWHKAAYAMDDCGAGQIGSQFLADADSDQMRYGTEVAP